MGAYFDPPLGSHLQYWYSLGLFLAMVVLARSIICFYSFIASLLGYGSSRSF